MNFEVKIEDVPGTNSHVRYEWLGYVLLAIAIVIGVVVRFKGIGRWALTDDEFYIAQSIKFILDHGIPVYESGGYYTRGLLYQYLAAGFLAFFSNAEFWLRAIPAASSILSVPALFWLGRRIGGKAVAYAVLILFMLSIWEIEFSRFARMYAIFQTIFLWYLVALYKVMIDEDRSCEKWLYFLSAAALFIYEGAVFLAILNFLPILYSKRLKFDSIRLWVPLLILVCTYLFLSYDFRRLGLDNYLPEEIANTLAPRSGKVLFPVFMLPMILKSPVWTILFLLTASINVWAGYRLLSSEADKLAKAGFLIIIISALLHQFGWMTGSAILLVSLYYKRVDFSWQKTRSFLLVAAGASLGYWIMFGIATTHWQSLLPRIPDPGLSKYILLIFNYPDVYAQVVWQWLKVMPVLSIILGVVTAAGFLKAIYDHREINPGFLFLVGILVMMILTVGLLKTPYASTRYSFFLYPLIMLLGVASMSTITRLLVRSNMQHALIFSLVIAAYMWIAEDYKFEHLYKIDSADINFRMGIDRDVAVHYYHRIDYRTPADIVNAAVNSDEIIVSIFTPTAYYLDRLDYIYMDDRLLLSSESAFNGEKELWTNANLLYKREQLWDLIENSPKPVWVIAGSEKNERNDSVKAISLELESRYSRFLVGSGIDQRIVVYYVVPENVQ